MRTPSIATLGTLAGLGTGAALMYLLDPDRGARRRAQLGRGLKRAGRQVAERAGEVASAVAERSQDALDAARAAGVLPRLSAGQRLAARARRIVRSSSGRWALGALLAAAALTGGTRLARETAP